MAESRVPGIGARPRTWQGQAGRLSPSRPHLFAHHSLAQTPNPPRLPLGTPYPKVARRVAEIAHRACGRESASAIVYVDATGVGQPVVDLLAEAQVPARIKPVYFTHGDRRTETHDEVKLGKAYLVSRLTALLQTVRVHLPATTEAEALAHELQDYEIRVDENANDRFGAFRVGTHDDLVTALGLAVQEEERNRSWTVDLWG